MRQNRWASAFVMTATLANWCTADSQWHQFETGVSEEWSIALPGAWAVIAQAPDGLHAYALSCNADWGVLLSVETATGELAWATFSPDLRHAVGEQPFSTHRGEDWDPLLEVSSTGSTLLVGTFDHPIIGGGAYRLSAFDAETGASGWMNETAGSHEWQYYWSDMIQLYGLDRMDMALDPDGEFVVASMWQTLEGAHFEAASHFVTKRIRLSDGAVVWEVLSPFDDAGVGIGGVAIAGDRAIVAGDRKWNPPAVLAYDLETGDLLWQREGLPDSTQTLAGGAHASQEHQLLYCSGSISGPGISDELFVAALDLHSGVEQWVAHAPGGLSPLPDALSSIELQFSAERDVLCFRNNYPSGPNGTQFFFVDAGTGEVGVVESNSSEVYGLMFALDIASSESTVLCTGALNGDPTIRGVDLETGVTLWAESITQGSLGVLDETYLDIEYIEQSRLMVVVQGEELVGLTTPSLAGENVCTISVSEGGRQNLHIMAGSANACLPYLALGSVTGTSPIVHIDGLSLPLVPDGYTNFTLGKPNSASLVNTFGELDSFGRAKAEIVVPGGLDVGLAGLTLHHACVVFDDALTATLISNAVSLVLIP